MRDDLNPLFDYAESLSGPVPDYLHELVRETYLKTLAPQMISGHLQGRILSLISKLAAPKRILEIGTFTGYSALCLAEGLAKGGELITIEGNPEVAWLAQKYFDASPFHSCFNLQSSSADAALAKLTGSFDLIFLDADKRRYPHYYEQLIGKLRPGGLFLSDNVLWDGRVTDPDDLDPNVRALDAYNRMLAQDPRIELLVIPVRDGLSVARKLY